MAERVGALSLETGTPAATTAVGPREAPNHDTLTCYTKYACRRPECVDRYLTNERERARLHRSGEYRRLTDAGPVRAHVQQLVAAGASARGIALRAPVSLRVVADLLPPRDGGRRTPVRHRLLTSNAEKLLAVTAQDVIPQYVLALGTSRRLQALVADAWPMIEIARWVDLYPSYISALIGRSSLYDDAHVMGTTALNVARGYDDLRGKRPARYGVSRRSAAYVRNLAKRRNWPPTRYWDRFPGAIDDPHFIPEYGKPRVTIIAEEAHWLMTTSRLDRDLVADRLGISRAYVDQALTAHPEAVSA